jgi:hypothetical protein
METSEAEDVDISRHTGCIGYPRRNDSVQRGGEILAECCTWINTLLLKLLFTGDKHQILHGLLKPPILWNMILSIGFTRDPKSTPSSELNVVANK